MDQVVAENGFQHVELLPAVNDIFGGVIVEMKEPMEPKAFCSQLRASVSVWKLQGKKGIWIKLPISLANLVETAVQEGFGYHHAEPHYLMMVRWIPESTNILPANASHRVGVGAIVLNDRRELLVVQEKNSKFRGTGVWKIPTGVVDEGEDLLAAVEREVKEETGIDAKFVEILASRQFHNSFFNKSDLVYICMMRPLSFDIQKQESEIEAAQWIPFGEYAAQPFTQRCDLAKHTAEICLAKLEREYAGFLPLQIVSFSGDPIMDTQAEIQERHDAVREVERKLLELQQISMDTAVLLDAQGDLLNNIEPQVSSAIDHVQSGNTALQHVKKLQRNSRKWMCVAVLIIVAVHRLKPWSSNKGA